MRNSFNLFDAAMSKPPFETQGKFGKVCAIVADLLIACSKEKSPKAKQAMDEAAATMITVMASDSYKDFGAYYDMSEIQSGIQSAIQEKTKGLA